jgi:transketolase
MALGAALRKDGAGIYTVIGDGESYEGLIWEAAMYAAHKKLSNLVAFTDCNKMQIDGMTKEINDLEPLTDKWKAFGWNVSRVDGHEVAAIDAAIHHAKAVREKPSMIILDTLKGKGVSFLEESWRNNHNVNISPEQHRQALEELGGTE